MTISILLLILLSLVFDFLNGFHDSANAIATVVSTRVLTPRRAVLFAAFFDFIAFLFFGTRVAHTIGQGIVASGVMDQRVIFATLIGACAWDLITWYLGLPTSSSHALIGGLIGAALVKVGSQSLVWWGITKTVAFIFISPILGLIIGTVLGTVVYWCCRKTTPRRVDQVFRLGQLVSAAFYSIGHGANDAQKTMGIITGLLLSAGVLHEFKVPLWVILACQGAIATGVMCGGWRIVKTMGQKVAKLKPVDGFAAESSAAVTLAISSGFGIPVSTTHTITGAIMGVGSLRRLSAVRWGVAHRIVWAWIVTIPAAAVISAAVYALVSRLFVAGS